VTAVILRGDAACLPLPDGSVDLIVTSPPYFGLRSYVDGGEHYDGQIGSEETSAAFVAALLDCTREWMRALRPSGSIFVNLGDKYAGGGGQWEGDTRPDPHKRRAVSGKIANGGQTYGLRPKSLIGLPWRYAIGCVDDLGLILRAEIVWSKPNGLPESVTDRVRRSHEQVFHFTKQPRYFAAVDEIREPQQGVTGGKDRRPFQSGNGVTHRSGNKDYDLYNPLGKLPGSVWDIPSQPLAVPARLGVDHFAAFPMELPRRIILGWSPSGICTECGEGRRPVADRELTANRKGTQTQRGISAINGGATGQSLGWERVVHITGYACACPQPGAPTRPAVVLDPFGGTGTTALVADMLGRTGVTIDRSADYCRIAQWRCADPGERARALGVPKPPPVIDGQRSLFDGLD
jgi:DNA modification methylase